MAREILSPPRRSTCTRAGKEVAAGREVRGKETRAVRCGGLNTMGEAAETRGVSAVGRGREERTSLPASVRLSDWEMLRSSSGSMRIPWASSSLQRRMLIETIQ